MTGIELVRQYFPKATEDQCDYILWEKTGFPSFYPSGEDPEEYFGRQLEKYRVAREIGMDVCACCGKIKHNINDGFACDDCRATSS